uniref:Cytochrome P450 n=1 Tax=Populus davidiana TaxID=266767 RepID=A0A6M2ETW1_9ROSI
MQLWLVWLYGFMLIALSLYATQRLPPSSFKQTRPRGLSHPIITNLLPLAPTRVLLFDHGLLCPLKSLSFCSLNILLMPPLLVPGFWLVPLLISRMHFCFNLIMLGIGFAS